MKYVLIVDDDPTVCSLFAMFLRARGFAVETASGSLEAFLKMEEQIPDLLITDILMPRMDGLALIREIRKKYPDLPLIAISGGKDRLGDFSERARKDGALLFLNKPVQMNDLLGAIRSLIGE